MKTKILSLLLLALPLLAIDYRVKLEPYQSISIKSEISGIVKNVKKANHSFVVKSSVVRLNATALDIEIASLKNELSNQNKIYKIQKARHASKSKLSSISYYEKTQEELSMRQALQSLYNLKKQLNLKKEQRKKYNFQVSKKYVGDIYVSEGEFVSPGMKIMDIYDISKSKLILYVSKEDLVDIRDKEIYVSGKKSEYKINYVASTTDTNYISSYKVELVKNNTDLDMQFGKVVQVEFKSKYGE